LSPIRITCGHDGAHADSLRDPSALEVPPDATLNVLVDDGVPRDMMEVSLTQCGGGRIPFEVVPQARGWRVIPVPGLVRGESYVLKASVALGFSWDNGNKLEREVTLSVPRIGVLDAIEADLCGDGNPDRIVVATDKVEVVCRSKLTELALPDIAIVKGAAVADFDLDGRVDVAVLGTDSNARAVLHWLRNTSLDGSLSFQARRVNLPSRVLLPVSIHAMDLQRDGLPDVVIGDFTGVVYPMLNRLRSVENPDPTKPFEAAMPLDVAPTVGRIRSGQVRAVNPDGYADYLVSGTMGSMLLKGTAWGLSPGQAHRHSGGASWAVGVPGEFSMLMQTGSSIDVVRFKGGKWEATPLFSLALISVEAMTVTGSASDGSTDILLAYRDGECGVLRRFADGPQGFADLNGRKLDGIGRVNAIRASATGSLMVCTEGGLWELEADQPARNVLSFDSRVEFDTPVQVAVLPPMSSYVLADVDGDGRLDVAGIATEDGRTSLGVWVNRAGATGVMSLVRSFTHALDGDAYSAVVSLDVNHDRMADVLLLPKKRGGAGLLFVAIGDGALREESPGYLATTPDNTAGPPIVVDLNGDGFADLFWPTPTGSIAFSNALLPSERGSFLPASGTVLAPALHPLTGQPLTLEGVATSDDFGTGRQDVVAVASSEDSGKTVRHVMVYRNEIRYGRQTADFRAETLEGAFDEVREVVTGEFEPGQRGVAALVREFDGDWIVAVWTRLDANTKWVRAIEFAGTNPSGLQALDVDDDGDTDLVMVPSATARNMALHINDGSGVRFSRNTMSSASLAEARANGPVRLARLQDLDGDGKPDLLAQAKQGDVIHSPGR